LHQIASVEPARPSAVNPQVGAGSLLEEVCVKLMAKSAASRYATMAEVAQTLEKAFTHVEAPAPKPSLWQWLCSWFRFSKAPATPPSPPTAEVQSGSAPSAPAASQLEETSADLSTPPTPAAAEAPPAAVPAVNPLEQTSAELSQAPEIKSKDTGQTLDLDLSDE
jgi:hypothetical protein